jgi:xanthine dehydrogenase accessory factor
MIRGELARRCEDLIAARAAFVVATVVRAQRPTSVLPGDAALVAPDGAIEGFVGGLCAEDSVRLHALRVMEKGEPLLLRILPSANEDGDASAAEGAVTVHNPCLSGSAAPEPTAPEPIAPEPIAPEPAGPEPITGPPSAAPGPAGPPPAQEEASLPLGAIAASVAKGRLRDPKVVAAIGGLALLVLLARRR